ncbi:SulP family inorganic anion transporter [Rhodoferax lacus]|uniref:SulP family inorganic anion transporter n=1 Tax=Rhodoferax lacus TaxID=2184758 RepID=UPI001F39B890|nr:sulfate permease [Rhodoferax lacus]
MLPLWLVHYRRENLSSDIVAGAILAILVIPQSLAYALLAGLPPQVGLYASILPVIAYIWLGSSSLQALGPVAITSIMTYAVLSPLMAPGSPQYITMAAGLCLLSGLMTMAFGFLRLGFLSQLLSRPVVSGFISGSAVLIIISQLKFLLGVQATGSNSWQSLLSLLEHVQQTNPVTLTLGISALLWLMLSRYGLVPLASRLGWNTKRAEVWVRVMPLVVLATASVAMVALELDTRHQVAVVGAIKEGLGGIHFFLPGLDDLRTLFAPALIMAFIGTVQNITMGQALAAKYRERLEPNRELVGLGAANVVAAFYSGMPVGGGLSRTAINLAAGARTPMASLSAAISMLLIVLAGTHWFARLPLAVLAASIVVAAISMIDLKAFVQAWNYDRADALALLGAAAGVLLLGLELGIATGILLSLVTLLVRASTPHIAVIGRIVGTEHFRNVERHGVETIPGALFLRIDESLFFGNLNAVEARLSAELMKDARICDLVLIMSAVNRVDTTAMEALTDVNRDLSARGIRLHLAEVKGPVQDRLLHSPLWKALSGKVHMSVNSAFETLAAERRVDTGLYVI